MSVNQDSSVETMGRKASEEQERKGTARVWTSSSDSEFSKIIGGGAEEDAAETGGAVEGQPTGTAGAETAGRPKASLTWDKKVGNWKEREKKKLNFVSHKKYLEFYSKNLFGLT